MPIRNTECFWTYFLKISSEDLSQIVWLCENWSAIEQELQDVKDKRLMELMQNEKPSRAFDDLQRNFYRTLSELRKRKLTKNVNM